MSIFQSKIANIGGGGLHHRVISSSIGLFSNLFIGNAFNLSLKYLNTMSTCQLIHCNSCIYMVAMVTRDGLEAYVLDGNELIICCALYRPSL